MFQTNTKEGLDKWGIYSIIIIAKTKKYIYIGGTANKKGFRQRWYEHINMLKKDIHHNIIVQRLFKKYSLKQFTFDVIEFQTDKGIIKEREDFFIKKFLSSTEYKCINICLTAFGTGDHWTYKRSQAFIKKVYASRKPVNQILKEQKRKLTISKLLASVKQDRINRHVQTFIANRQKHKAYNPLNIEIRFPDGKKENKLFETEQEFLDGTNFENSVLLKIKRTKEHTVKRYLPLTRHSYPIGTQLIMTN